MVNFLPFRFAALFSVLFLLTFSNCKKTVQDEQYYQTISQYVAAYSGGSIGASEPIVVRFTSPVVGTDKVGTEAESNLFSISPKVAGKAVWEDVQTLKFQPDKRFDYGGKYQVEIPLDRLFSKVPNAAQDFIFDVSVRELGIDVDLVGLVAASANDETKQLLRGQFNTSDPVPNDQVEANFQAEQGSTVLPITWAHSSDGKGHEFTVLDIERKEKAGELQLEWSGKTIGAKSNGEQKVEVPALAEFKIMMTEVVQMGEQHVRIHFSDALKTDQNLEGLIRFEGYDGQLRTLIEGNDIRVYPQGNIEGSFTVLVNQAVQNRKGKKLDKPGSFVADFAPLKPAVRLVGSGNIIPKETDGAVLFPFDAVGLNAVDVEIFKIYDNNILHFLQNNDLQNRYNLEQVGKIILQKKVVLSDLNPRASNQGWARYALDLKPLISQDPKAIYQVRMLFRRSYTTMPCNQREGMALEENEDLAHLGKPDDWGNLTSMMGDYNGIYEFKYGYYDDEENEDSYQWDQRDNPCRKEYYNEDNFIARNVFVSDLGIMAKMGESRSLLLMASDLNSAAPVAGVAFDVFNYQLQKIATATTNNGGTVRVDNLSDKPFIVAASEGNQRGYLRLPEGNSLSLSRFDVAGVESQKGIKGFLYGERGVWRPGDSIFLNFVVEDQEKVLPKDVPVTFELKDSKGTLRQKMVTTHQVGGVFPLHTATPADAPTGTWQAKVMVGGSTFTKSLFIETVKPNRLKINADFGKYASGIKASDKEAKAQLNVKYLHGADGGDLPVKVEMQVRPQQTKFEGYLDWVFDDPARQVNGESKVIFDGKADASGNVDVPLAMNFDGGAPGKLKANLRIRAFEKGGDFSTSNETVDISPFDFYVGMFTPKDRWGSKRLDRGKGSEIVFVMLDDKGRPIGNREINVGLYRVDWRYWWDSDANSVYGRYNTTNHADALKNAVLRTNAKGEASWTVQPNQWGRYMVRAIDPIGGHATGDFFWTGYPDNSDDPQARSAAAMLQFQADKESYEVGETVTLNIPSSENGRIFVSLENGRQVIDHFWQEAKAGDNAVRFRTDESMAATLYAHVMLLQPHENRNNDLPIRLYGIVPINVVNKKSKLEPIIAMPDKVEPGESFTVTVSEKSGQNCAYTLAIADEGLLDLTGFKTPNPWDAFNAREGLGVQTWDIFDNVLGAFGGTLEKVFGIGGDAFNQQKNAAQISRFKPVVQHIGPFNLKRGEKAKHTFKIDNYVGSVRAMLVCSSPEDKGEYGASEKAVAVKKPLMVQPTLPRVLGPGETFRVPVSVFAMENSVKNASVSLKSGNSLVSVLSGNQNLSFSKPSDQLVYFDVKVGEKTGPTQFTVEAKGNGGVSAKQTIDIEVRNPNPVVSTVLEGVAQAKKAWSQNLSALNMTDLESLELEVSAIKPINLSRHLGYLIRYPYGCVEQTTSGAFPQLYVDVIAPLSDKQAARIDKNVNAAIAKLQNFQNTDGGFAYWPGGNEADNYASTYVGHFLLEAKSKGYQVPAAMLSKWENYQRKVARSWSPPKEDKANRYHYHDDELTQAYRLYTLAMTNSPDLANMNRLKEVPQLYGTSAQLLAAAYAKAGQGETAKRIISQSNFKTFEYSYWGRTYGSQLRDRALELESAVLNGDMKRAQQLMEGIADVLGDNGRWHNTQELANCLRAIAKYAEKVSGGSTFQYNYALGNQKEKVQSKHLISRISLDADAVGKTLSFENQSGGTLYARIIAQGREKVGSEREIAKNIDLTVRYVDEKGNPVAIEKLPQGKDFFAEVTIAKKADSDLNFPFKEMALKQVFPSGWEIVSNRISGIQAQGESPMEYRDIRDDRVFTFFDIPYQWYGKQPDQRATFRIQLHAAYPGKYYLPAVDCEAMYDDRIMARSGGRWVEVI